MMKLYHVLGHWVCRCKHECECQCDNGKWTVTIHARDVTKITTQFYIVDGRRIRKDDNPHTTRESAIQAFIEEQRRDIADGNFMVTRAQGLLDAARRKGA